MNKCGCKRTFEDWKYDLIFAKIEMRRKSLVARQHFKNLRKMKETPQ